LYNNINVKPESVIALASRSKSRFYTKVNLNIGLKLVLAFRLSFGLKLWYLRHITCVY